MSEETKLKISAWNAGTKLYLIDNKVGYNSDDFLKHLSNDNMSSEFVKAFKTGYETERTYQMKKRFNERQKAHKNRGSKIDRGRKK